MIYHVIVEQRYESTFVVEAEDHGQAIQRARASAATESGSAGSILIDTIVHDVTPA